MIFLLNSHIQLKRTRRKNAFPIYLHICHIQGSSSPPDNLDFPLVSFPSTWRTSCSISYRAVNSQCSLLILFILKCPHCAPSFLKSIFVENSILGWFLFLPAFLNYYHLQKPENSGRSPWSFILYFSGCFQDLLIFCFLQIYYVLPWVQFSLYLFNLGLIWFHKLLSV